MNGDARRDEMRIYISPVMFFMAVYFVAVGMAYEFCCSLAAVILHECAHAKVAKKLGYELNVVKLMPYGAALCGELDATVKHEVIIALAGPLFNFAVAVPMAALWWLLPNSYIFTKSLCVCSLYIGLFNLLPVYPLDGGRAVYALLSSRIKRAKAFLIMRAISFAFGGAAIVLFALSAVYAPNLSLLGVGAFMLLSAFIPDDKARYRALFAVVNRYDRLKRPVEVRRFAVSSDAVLGDICGVLDVERYSEFIVLNGELVKCGGFTETELTSALKRYGYAEKVEKVFLKSEKRENKI